MKKKMKSIEKVLAYPKASLHVVISFPTSGHRKIFWFEGDLLYADEHLSYLEE